MNLSINKNIVFGIVFFFSCLVNCILPLDNWPMPIALIFLYVAIIFLLLSDYKSIFKFFRRCVLNKKSIFTPFLIFLAYLTVSSVIFVLLGKIPFIKNLVPFVGGIIMQMTAAILFAFYMTYKKLKTKVIIKIIFSILYFIMFMGIVDFVFCYLEIQPLIDALKIFANERMFLSGGEYANLDRVVAYSHIRIQGVFVEPGGFGSFIAFFMPMIYTLSRSKFKIYSNKYIDKFIKNSIIPIIWFDIILTQSPIYLVICTLITIIYFHKVILNNMKIFFSLGFLILIFAISYTFFNDLDISETYLSRIQKVIEALGNFDVLIYTEPSLATRLVNYYNTLVIWTHHPIFGVGLGALPEHMVKQIPLSKLPLTPEIIINYSKNSRFSFNTGFFYKYIAETGIIGITLIYYFMINSTLKLKKKLQYTSVSIENDFGLALTYTVCTFCALSFYNIAYLSLFIWLIIGIEIGIYYKISSDKSNFIKLDEEKLNTIIKEN